MSSDINPTSSGFQVINPLQLDPLIEQLVATKLQEAEQHYANQLALRDQAWAQREAELQAREAAMRSEYDAMASRLADHGTPDGNTDTPMADVQLRHASSLPPTPPAPGPTKKCAAGRKSAVVDVFTPTRTLRSSSKRDIESHSPSAEKVIQPKSTPTKPRLSTRREDRASVTPSKKGRATTKPGSHIHRLLPSEIPADVGGLHKALSLHIRLLWGLIDTKQVPRDPSHQLLSAFNVRISTEAALLQCRDGPAMIPISRVNVCSVPLTSNGLIARQARLVEEHILEYIQGCLARFGLTTWCPDLRQTAYSLYNSACRIIALDTFKQALVSHAYAHLKPNTTYAKDMTLLIKLYDHFVHHFVYSRYKMELRRPGSVQAAEEALPQYQNRKRLAAARLGYLKENNYPQRYCDVISTKATSDDELDPSGHMIKGRKVYLIKRRPERSEAAELFIRRLDEDREKDARQDPSRRWRERLRIVPEGQQDTQFPSLPENAPIDYFSPQVFNSLGPRLRSRITNLQVAFLPNIQDSFRGDPDERLSDHAFMDKHGERVLAQYKLADLGEEADDEEEGEWIDDDDEDMEDLDLTDGEDNADVEAKRNTILSHLT